MGELARDVEQIRQLPALKLELDLAERRRASSCMDRAPIERQGDCPLVVGQRVDRPAHASLEQRLELAPEFPLRQRLERGTGGQVQIRLRARQLGFPFAALEQMRIRARFDRLDVAVAYAAHA